MSQEREAMIGQTSAAASPWTLTMGGQWGDASVDDDAEQEDEDVDGVALDDADVDGIPLEAVTEAPAVAVEIKAPKQRKRKKGSTGPSKYSGLGSSKFSDESGDSDDGTDDNEDIHGQSSRGDGGSKEKESAMDEAVRAAARAVEVQLVRYRDEIEGSSGGRSSAQVRHAHSLVTLLQLDRTPLQFVAR